MTEINELTPEWYTEAAETEELCLSEHWSAESIKATIDNNGLYFMALCDGKMAGHIGATFAAGECYITNMAVRGEYRKKGIGSGLLNKLLLTAEDRNCEFVSLEVRESNTEARSLYENNGFQIVGERKRFYTNPEESALIMTIYYK